MRVLAGLAGTALAAWMLPGHSLAVRMWAAVLLVALPAAALAQARMLAREPELPVVPAYVSTIVSLAVLAAVTAMIAWTAGLTPARLGLFPTGALRLLLWSIGLTAAGVGIVFLGRALGVRETGVTLQLLPTTATERRLFVLVSAAAGLFEEFLYRGFLFLVLDTNGGAALATALSAASFGIVHGYQARAGMVRAAILGLVFTLPVLLGEGILPAILAHFAVDLLIGLVWADRLRS